MIYLRTSDTVLRKQVMRIIEQSHIAPDWGTVRAHVGQRTVAGIVCTASPGPAVSGVWQEGEMPEVVIVVPLAKDDLDRLPVTGAPLSTSPYVQWKNPHDPRQSLQQALADAVRRRHGRKDLAAERFVSLCLSDPPPASVGAASRMLATPPRYAGRLLEEILCPPGSLTLEHVLDWIRLLWACESSRRKLKVLVLGVFLQRDPRSLQRSAHRLTGHSLSDLRADPGTLLETLLARWGLPPSRSVQ